VDIRTIMSAAPISARPEWPLDRAIELLIEHGISGLPVVDAENRIVGVLSEKDLLALFGGRDSQVVGDLMTADPITFSVDAPLVEVVDCLMTYDFRRILIHDRGKLAGLVSRADLMPVILDLLRQRARPNER
jgi:tRNA nucleotidyltransferase (CCA-adding enzyme)